MASLDLKYRALMFSLLDFIVQPIRMVYCLVLTAYTSKSSKQQVRHQPIALDGRGWTPPCQTNSVIDPKGTCPE